MADAKSIHGISSADWATSMQEATERGKGRLNGHQYLVYNEKEQTYKVVNSLREAGSGFKKMSVAQITAISQRHLKPGVPDQIYRPIVESLRKITTASSNKLEKAKSTFLNFITFGLYGKSLKRKEQDLELARDIGGHRTGVYNDNVALTSFLNSINFNESQSKVTTQRLLPRQNLPNQTITITDDDKVIESGDLTPGNQAIIRRAQLEAQRQNDVAYSRIVDESKKQKEEKAEQAKNQLGGLHADIPFPQVGKIASENINIKIKRNIQGEIEKISITSTVQSECKIIVSNNVSEPLNFQVNTSCDYDLRTRQMTNISRNITIQQK